MAIDQYEHDFQYLVESDLAEHMQKLQEAMTKPLPMSEFAIDGLGVVGLCNRYRLEADFSGCYVLMDGDSPIYVGISKSVLQRLRQHVRGTTHFDASLAYRIVARNMPHNHTRSRAMEEDDFKEQFDRAKAYLRGLNVAFVEIVNPLVLYVFEPYCAMTFDTSDWNTFETH